MICLTFYDRMRSGALTNACFMMVVCGGKMNLGTGEIIIDLSDDGADW